MILRYFFFSISFGFGTLKNECYPLLIPVSAVISRWKANLNSLNFYIGIGLRFLEHPSNYKHFKKFQKKGHREPQSIPVPIVS